MNKKNIEIVGIWRIREMCQKKGQQITISKILEYGIFCGRFQKIIFTITLIIIYLTSNEVTIQPNQLLNFDKICQKCFYNFDRNLPYFKKNVILFILQTR